MVSSNIDTVLNDSGTLTVGKTYTAPTVDNHAAPKKYVDDLIGGPGDIIDLAFKAAYSTYYSEYQYTNGDLTQIDIWETASKITKLFTKVLVYSSGNLSSITTTDEINSNTLAKTFTYDVNGDLISSTKNYT